MKFAVDYTNGEDRARWTIDLSSKEIESLATMIMTGVQYRTFKQTTDDISTACKFSNLTAIAMTKGSPWNNETRSRYYGLRIGDIVKSRGDRHRREKEGEVVGFGFMDNNAVFVVWEGSVEVTIEVAEPLEILTKLEDRK